MEFVALALAGIIFLYSLYKLVKDDHVFIRKGISLEQSFDIAFTCLWLGLIISRLFFLFFQYPGQNIFLNFFSLKYAGFSLVGAIIGAMIALYFVSKVKKLPLGRMGDFLSLSFLTALPIGYLAGALMHINTNIIHFGISTVSFLILLLFFRKFLYPKLLNRSIREGTITILFLMFFSFISLATALINAIRTMHIIITGSNIAAAVMLIFMIILFWKQEKPFAKHRRTLHH